MFTLWIIKLTTRPHDHISPIISQPWLESFILSLAAWCEKHNTLGEEKKKMDLPELLDFCYHSFLERGYDYLIWWLPVSEAELCVSAAAFYCSSYSKTALGPTNGRQCHSAQAAASHGAPLTQRLFCVTSISDSRNDSSVLEGGGRKKGKENGTVVGADCRSRAQSVCSQRCGMKSQKKTQRMWAELLQAPNSCSSSQAFYCAAAAARGKPPHHNKMEMRRKGEEMKAADLFVRFRGARIEEEKKNRNS